jgi:acetaldehyde dehydrogenase (acetylating)
MDRDLESIQQVRRLIEKAAEAAKVLARFSQPQTDAIVASMAEAARRSAEPLARLAVEETTYGVVADKVEKNLFSARDVYSAIKNLKTAGIVGEDAENGIVEIAVPAGVVAAIIPCTNPTSTAIFKALIALKGRNSIVMSPHPSAAKCIAETCRVMEEAARQAGAPEGAIGCITLVTNQATEELMRHPKTAIIVATGGAGMVRAAYSSGKPALGVGPGNVPAYIHGSANVVKAVADILYGKCFDNGTICSSEQHMVVDQAVADQVRAEAERQGGFFLSPEQGRAVARVLILPNFRVNAKMVGQGAETIARAAGISIPSGTRALIAPLEGIGRDHPLSAEKLSPVLSFRVVKDWREGLEVCRRLLEFGGLGHTMAIHAADEEVVRAMALELPAFRLVVNTPSPHGSIGYSTKLLPSMSLGCGTLGGNITSDNLSPLHLINIKRLAWERRPVTTPSARAAAPALPASGLERSSPPSPSMAVPKAASAAEGPGSSEFSREEIARLVERFLSARGHSEDGATASPRPASPASGCASAAPPETPCNPPASGAPSPSPRPVDFVCEEDVRRALRQGEKIYITSRTIVTPAAHDLGNAREIFVLL